MSQVPRTAPPVVRETPTSTSTSTPTLAFTTFLHERFVDVFLSQNRRAQFGLLLACCLLAFIWSGQVQAQGFAAWLAAVLAVTSLRYRFSERFVRRGFSPAACDATAQAAQIARIAALLFLNGLLLALPLLAFRQMSDIERAALSIILMASATASVTTTSGYKFLFLAFTAPMLLPLALAWATQHHEGRAHYSALGLAVLILLFQLFLLGMGQKVHRDFEESARFRYGEQGLNRQLQGALAAADLSNRAKTQFLATASHDLKQPIYCVNLLVAALNLRRLDQGASEIAAQLAAVNQVLTRQLDTLLDISKLDAGVTQPQLKVVRLDLLALQHQGAMAAVARERGLEFVLEVQDEVSALTDEALFTRVLSNLTDNAFKYTRRGGSVRLRVWCEGWNAVLTVADSGIGIAPEHHEPVFGEFFQVAAAGPARVPGLGLGLAIVRRLCSLLKVQLSMTSAVGVGTSVSLRLPTAANAEVLGRPACSAADTQGLTLLFIDDDESVRRSMRLLLEELGCTVYLADGVEQAMAHARQHQIDFVLSDFCLAVEQRGTDVIRVVRQLHPRARAALLSGDSTAELMLAAQAAGLPVLYKPLALPALLAVLRTAEPAEETLR